MRKKRFSSLEIWRQEAGHYVVSGNLTFAGIDWDIARKFPFLQGPGPVILDFSEIQKTDSAGLALIVEWIKFAKRQKIALLFENIPAQLLTLAKLSGFEQLLEEGTRCKVQGSREETSP